MNEVFFYNIVFPIENELVKEFTVSRWHKRIGEWIEKGETLYSIENAYFEMEIPSPYTGLLIEIFVGENQKASADTVLARIEGA